MLNLNNPVQYTQKELEHISSLMSRTSPDGTLVSGPDMWKDGKTATKSLKRKISLHTINHQECRCAYCESLLSAGSVAIEHFAPKEHYRDFTFEPLNLTSACSRCNSTTIKGAKNTIKGTVKADYASNMFTIVHPYLCPNPDKEIVFTDDTRTTFDRAKCSKLGLATIDFFQWDNEDARLTRLKEAAIRNLPFNKAKLLMEITTYK